MERRVAAIQADWRARWPAVFAKPVPLAVGFARQIRAAVGTDATRKEIGAAIHRWTMQSAYLRAVARGEMRRNLDGTDAGVPEDAAREWARKLLEERAARHAAQAQRKQEKKPDESRSAASNAAVTRKETFI